MSWIPNTFDNYNRMGDVGVIAICCVIFILLASSYVSRTLSFRVFSGIVGVLFLAALIDIGYHDLILLRNPALNTWIYILRIVYVALLFNTFFLFSLYTSIVSNLEHKKARIIAVAASLMLVVFVSIDVILTVRGIGFHIDADGTVHGGFDVFMIGYLLFAAFLASQMFRIRNHLFKRVLYGFYGVMAVSVSIRIGQYALNQSSLTTLTFSLPAIAMLYFMHSSPYNVVVGTLDIRAMEDYVQRLYKRKAPFIFMSLLLPDFNVEGKSLPESIQAQTRRFSRELFRNGILFMLGNGHIVMIAAKKRNPDYEEWMKNILQEFLEQFENFKLPYKIVYGESMEEISRDIKYADLIESANAGIPLNTIHRVNDEDIARFSEHEYILAELKDICEKHDLDDPRVLAYCQPVLNCHTHTLNSAEALMRLNLEKTGVIYPDSFIPLAESHGYIHVLTEIILHKTCQEIRKLSAEGFAVKRISVNVSVLELRSSEFCGDIERIIRNAEIPSDKIAIELTESHSEADFMIMKEIIEKLHRQGIQFYLDDFGTGYSNMERIMELPFDIIKFDRTMLIACDKDDRSAKMVNSLANMFRDMAYSVLYEGVEDDADEALCAGMSASYLQGYKYSRPVPIERLREFLPKAM
ncbi:MAG: EAL domain-containing protein [Oscillospiraceae bacterium]|nr:EAL domain-containing protein [Oscillospiraceae bacterium]